MQRVGPEADPSATAQQVIAIAFFQAFTERFLGATPSAAADNRRAAAQVATLRAAWV